MPDEQSVDARALFDEIVSYINDAKEIVGRGEFIELEKLDKKVESLCGAVQRLTVEEATGFREDLSAMMQELEGLQRLFQSKKDALAQEVSDVGKHKKAAVAYKQSEVASARALDNPSSD